MITQRDDRYVRDNRIATAGWSWPVSWPAIVAGAFAGLGVLLLLGAFWAAIGSEWSFVARNFKWFQMGDAFAAWFVAGFVTGFYASRSGSPMRGASHGFVVWSVLLVVRTVIAIPSAVGAISFALATSSGSPQWASFAAIAGGLIAAILGGVVGGSARALAPAGVYGRPADRDRSYDDDMADERGFRGERDLTNERDLRNERDVADVRDEPHRGRDIGTVANEDREHLR